MRTSENNIMRLPRASLCVHLEFKNYLTYYEHTKKYIIYKMDFIKICDLVFNLGIIVIMITKCTNQYSTGVVVAVVDQHLHDCVEVSFHTLK